MVGITQKYKLGPQWSGIVKWSSFKPKKFGTKAFFGC